MKIFEQEFAPGTRVAVFYTPESTSVRVYTPRPDPTWIPKEKVGRKQTPLDEVKDDIVKLVILKPGYGPTYYTQTNIKHGGAKGSRERKEEAFKELVNEGKVIVKLLDKPIGRRKHAVYAAE